MHRLFVALAAIAIIVGIGVALSARSIVGTPPVTPQAVNAAPTPAPTVVAAEPPTQPVPTATTVPPTAVPTAVPTPDTQVVLEISEADLNDQFSRSLVGQPLGKTPLGDATVQSVAIQLRDRRVRLDGNATVGFLQAPFVVIGTVAPNGAGRPIVTVNQATVAGAALPDAARDALAESFQLQVDEMFLQRDVKIRTIDIADGKMRVVGTQGPYEACSSC